MISKKINIEETSLTVYRLTYLFSPFDFDITNNKSIEQYYYFSVITEILIHLRDLSQKLEIIGDSIDFTDHIQEESKFNTVIALIKYFRDAACHNDSINRRNKKGYIFSANVFASFDFEDDITLLMGDEKLFVKRHLVAVFRIILKKLCLYPEFSSNQDFTESISNAKAQGHFKQVPNNHNNFR